MMAFHVAGLMDQIRDQMTAAAGSVDFEPDRHGLRSTDKR